MHFKPYIRETVVVPFSGETISAYPFTKDTWKEKVNNRANSPGRIIKIDEKDSAILRIFSCDGRASLSSISKKVGLKPSSVKYRIDNLISKKVILGFIPKINMEKLGYSQYKVDINLYSTKEHEKMQLELLTNPNVYSLINTIGWADLEVRMFARNSKQFFCMLHKIRDEFSDDVVGFESFQYPEIVKNEYMSDF